MKKTKLIGQNPYAMAETVILFPNQLYSSVKELEPDRVYLVEDRQFFTQYSFHKKKLVLHRASMKAFQDELDFFDPVNHYLGERIRDLDDSALRA